MLRRQERKDARIALNQDGAQGDEVSQHSSCKGHVVPDLPSVAIQSQVNLLPTNLIRSRRFHNISIFLVATLDVSRSLEADGFPDSSLDRITSALEVLPAI